MPDEMVTDEIIAEVNSSDAASAEEFLFGHDEEESAHDAAAAEVAEAEDSQGDPEEDAEQDTRNSHDAGEQTEPADELKVVVSIRGGRATIGVQQPSADPHIEAFDGLDLPGLAQEVPGVAERARDRWEGTPKYPAYEKPAPTARRQRQRRQAPVEAATEEGETEQEQPETLRLF
ncbi:MAG: hypothetical protein F4Y04_02660 [Chloroflexi bacterium]|nr:hypothetical protein [Chloroflexota bacterium]